jgi:hypothetical protein
MSCPSRRGRLLSGEAGQSTAEYALVILAAAVVAGLLIAWAGSGAVTRLFDTGLDRVLRATG